MNLMAVKDACLSVSKRSSKMTTSSVYSTSVVKWSKDGDKQNKMFAPLTSFPHVWKQLLSSGDHTFEEVLDVEDAFQLHGPCRSNDGVVVLEQGELYHDGPIVLGRCRGYSTVGSFYLEGADVGKGNIIVIMFDVATCKDTGNAMLLCVLLAYAAFQRLPRIPQTWYASPAAKYLPVGRHPRNPNHWIVHEKDVRFDVFSAFPPSETSLSFVCVCRLLLTISRYRKRVKGAFISVNFMMNIGS